MRLVRPLTSACGAVSTQCDGASMPLGWAVTVAVVDGSAADWLMLLFSIAYRISSDQICFGAQCGLYWKLNCRADCTTSRRKETRDNRARRSRRNLGYAPLIHPRRPSTQHLLFILDSHICTMRGHILNITQATKSTNRRQAPVCAAVRTLTSAPTRDDTVNGHSDHGAGCCGLMIAVLRTLR